MLPAPKRKRRGSVCSDLTIFASFFGAIMQLFSISEVLRSCCYFADYMILMLNFVVIELRLASERTRQLLRGHDSTLAELSTLKTTMDLVNKMVNDIDPCTFGMQNIDPASALNNFLNEIKNLVYDTEDLVEQILTKTQRSSSTRHQIGQVVSRLNPFHERSVVKIREKNEKFDRFTRLLVEYCTDNLSISHWTPYILYSAQTSSAVDESMVVGRDSEREQIFKVLEGGVPRVEHRRLLRGKDILSVSVPVDKDIRVIVLLECLGLGKPPLLK